MSVLDEILESTREEIEPLRGAHRAFDRRETIDLAVRLRRQAHEPLRVIAEIKKKSPSAGSLSTALSVADRARIYAREGASLISVLVDRGHFDGSFEDLGAASIAAEPTPTLCKGFVIDEVQCLEARARGAHAVLLIVRLFEDDAPLRALFRTIVELGMTPIVEVIDERELERATAMEAKVIGVNARDLATLSIDHARAQRVLQAIPRDRVALAFSGVKGPGDVARIAAIGRGDGERPIDGVLIGESLMRLDDPSLLLRAMIDAARA